MIHSVCASTNESDDLQLGLEELLQRLDLPKISTYRYKVGIVTATEEFLDNGFIPLLKESLPFEFVGFQTFSCITPDADIEAHFLNFSIMVLLSNDVEFVVDSAVITETGYDEEIKALYRRSTAERSDSPSMIFGLANVFPAIPVDSFLSSIETASGGVPCFGSVGVRFIDTGVDFFRTKSIYNDEDYQSRFAFILFYGKIDPYFEVLSIPPHKVLNQDALITKAEGVVIKTVNNIPATKYFHSIGFDTANIINAVSVVPIIIHYGDNTQPVARNIYRLTEDDEGVYLAGSAPQGATIGIGSIDKNDVVATASTISSSIAENSGASAAIVFSCGSRNISLGYDAGAEIQSFASGLNQECPYLFASSGGEVCPVSNPNSSTGYTNRFHNNSIVLCLLR